uniref:Uncharacterized protein n=1 Tax=Angiostrongylus cantonensis TaxID=6313 RepID=A0A158P9T9_ANGCA
MSGINARTQRSASSSQIPTDFKQTTSSVPVYEYSISEFIVDLRTHGVSSTQGTLRKRKLNVERGELRRKPMRFKNIREPFNHLRWNFTKLPENEVSRRV